MPRGCVQPRVSSVCISPAADVSPSSALSHLGARMGGCIVLGSLGLVATQNHCGTQSHRCHGMKCELVVHSSPHSCLSSSVVDTHTRSSLGRFPCDFGTADVFFIGGLEPDVKPTMKPTREIEVFVCHDPHSGHRALRPARGRAGRGRQSRHVHLTRGSLSTQPCDVG